LSLPIQTNEIVAVAGNHLGYSMENLDKKVIQLISKQFNIEASLIKPEYKFIDDLNCDSLDLVEFIVNLEEEFGIIIPDDQTEKISTVQDALDFINLAKPV
jgi:acyl carrier protein